MNRLCFLGFLVVVTASAWAIANAQQPAVPETNVVAETYRVVSFPEMFAGDEEAKQRLAEYMFHIQQGDEPHGTRRNDMHPTDYERALNRLAADGWTLVTVNKSNYWVFKKTE